MLPVGVLSLHTSPNERPDAVFRFAEVVLPMLLGQPGPKHHDASRVDMARDAESRTDLRNIVQPAVLAPACPIWLDQFYKDRYGNGGATQDTCFVVYEVHCESIVAGRFAASIAISSYIPSLVVTQTGYNEVLFFHRLSTMSAG
jgi:hypothetical protein